jgi:hypothetical protein
MLAIKNAPSDPTSLPLLPASTVKPTVSTVMDPTLATNAKPLRSSEETNALINVEIDSSKLTENARTASITPAKTAMPLSKPVLNVTKEASFTRELVSKLAPLVPSWIKITKLANLVNTPVMNVLMLELVLPASLDLPSKTENALTNVKKEWPLMLKLEPVLDVLMRNVLNAEVMILTIV